jgi:hypothetical protein
MNNMRDPDITIISLINPPAVGSQFSFVVLEFRRKIVCVHRTGMEAISLIIPPGKTVIQTRIERRRIRNEIPVRHKEFLFSFYKKRALFSRRLDRSVIDENLGFFVLTHTQPVESFLQNIE